MVLLRKACNLFYTVGVTILASCMLFIIFVGYGIAVVLTSIALAIKRRVEDSSHVFFFYLFFGLFLCYRVLFRR